MIGWAVVVPVKDARLGKSRLAGHLSDETRIALVRAMAGDTIAAAAAAPGVRLVVVVTGDAEVARTAHALAGARVDVVLEPSVRGLNAAVLAGVDRVRELDARLGTGALLGDLPALRPDDLGAALAAASEHARAFVADAEGTGTTLLVVRPGIGLDPAFGPGSAHAHAARGHVRLDVDAGSSLRHDVDVLADLDAIEALGAGPRTRAALAASRVAVRGRRD